MPPSFSEDIPPSLLDDKEISQNIHSPTRDEDRPPPSHLHEEIPSELLHDQRGKDSPGSSSNRDSLSRNPDDILKTLDKVTLTTNFEHTYFFMHKS